jgi:CheY-like chemotaxis protein
MAARGMANRPVNSSSASDQIPEGRRKRVIALEKDNLLGRSGRTALKILAVDDEPAIAACLSFIFRGPRYELTSARNGREALAQLSAAVAPYDVVITDNNMPQLSGVELVRALRERSFGGKIMVLAAHLTSENRDAFAQMKVDAILDKPFDHYELRNRLDLLVA